MTAGPEADPAEPAREHLGGVIGVGLGLLILVGLVSSLAVSRAETLEPQALFERWFEPAPPAFGLVALEAARAAAGTEMLRLSNPAAPPEAPAAELEPKQRKPRGAKGPSEPEFDWRSIEIGPEGAPPIEALLLSWPLKRAERRLDALFSGSSGGGQRSSGGGGGGPRRSSGRDGPGFEDLYAGLGDEGGKRVLARGRIAWGEFEAPFVHVREFEPGGTFVDTLRVNLSSETEPLALLLRWPRGFPADEARAEELLASLVRRAPE